MGFFKAKTWSGCTRLGALALAAFLGLSCHYFEDDESGSNVSPSQLRGSWYGIVRHLDGSLDFMTIVVDEDSNIASIDGDTSLTGAISFYTGDLPFEGFRLYTFSVSDGTTTEEGGFYVDNIFSHVTMVFENGDFAVLQRNLDAADMPSFINEDIERRWTGFVKGRYVNWDSNYEVSDVGQWEFRTEYPDPAIGNQIPYRKSEDKDAPIAGYFTKDPNPQWGVWVGRDTPTGPDPRPLVAIMTGDKKYAGTIECGPADFPECQFTVWGIVLLQTGD